MSLGCVYVCACVGDVPPQTLCPAGRFSSATGATSLAECSACTTGNFCPIGSPSVTACGPGTYNPLTAQTNVSACVGCPMGRFCAGATTTPAGCGNASYFCPANSSAPTLVGVGNYSTPVGGNATGQVVCEPGSFCISGVKSPCVAGTYANDVRMRVCVDGGDGVFVSVRDMGCMCGCGG